jgi:hypothetical protein
MIGSKFLVAKKVPILSASGVTKHAEDEDHTLRNVGMGAAFAYPLAVGLANNRKAPAQGTRVNDFKEFLKQVQPGDIIASGRRDYYPVKGAIAAISGQPDYYHIMTALENIPSRAASRFDDAIYDPDTPWAPQRLGRKVTVGEASGEGSAITMKHLADEAEGYRILRPKNKEHASRIVQHVERVYDDPKILYSMGLGKKSGLYEMLVPDFLRRTKDYSGMNKKQLADAGMAEIRCTGGMCSNLPATAVPEIWNKSPGMVLPNDILTSEHFEPVADYLPGEDAVRKSVRKKIKEEMPHLSNKAIESTINRRMARWSKYDSALRGGRAHWYTRGALGLAGAGLVGAASRIPDSDLSLGEGLAGAGLVSAPIAAKLLSLRASEDEGHRYMTEAMAREHEAISALKKSGLSEAQAYKRYTANARKEIYDFLAKERINIPKKNINIDFRNLDLDDRRKFDFRDLYGSNAFWYDKNKPYLTVSPDRPTYLRELGRAKYLSEDPSRVVDLSKLSDSKVLRAQLRELLGSQKEALKYVYRNEGLGGALRYARQATPSLTPFIDDALSTVKKPIRLAGLAGLGILGSQLYKDKEQSALDRLKSALGIEV